MPIKAVVDTLEEIEDESVKPLYKEAKIKAADGKDKTVYAFELEGVDGHPAVMALKNAHERQKQETAKAKARVAELEPKLIDLPEDFSIDEWNRLKTVDEEVKKNPSDPEKKKLFEAEVQSLKNMYEQKLANAPKKAEAELRAEREAHAQTKLSLRNRVVGDDLTKALAEAGIDKRYLKAAKALLEKSVKVTEDNGQMNAVVDTDLGETPIAVFVPQWAQSDEGKAFVVPATGSGAPGSDGGNSRPGNLATNPFTKAAWSMTAQAQIFKQDAAKAERLAKAAGHAKAIGAKKEDAK